MNIFFEYILFSVKIICNLRLLKEYPIILGQLLTLNNFQTMKKLLTVLHAEDRLSPSALSIVKGGDGEYVFCQENNCTGNSGSCNINNCQGNNAYCDRNGCSQNFVKLPNPNPDPSCKREVITT